MSSIAQVIWGQSDSLCEVSASDGNVASKIWFRKRVDRDFCFRVTQLQLCTESHDQGHADDKSAGSWTWFELVILADETSDQPKTSKDGHELVWRSHSNRLADALSPTSHFGATFDRRSDLLVNLEVGDFLAVRVCARFPGWVNSAAKGCIVARVINEDLFTPYRWTLASEVLPTLSDTVEDGCYTFVSTTKCLVKSEGNDLTSQIWFTTPALDERTIDNLEAVQLFTSSRFQESQKESVPEGDSFSWFDLVILNTPTDTEPRVENGVSLVWKSHVNDSSKIQSYYLNGKLYDVQDDQNSDLQSLAIALKGALKPGNAIGVRVNAQYPGWENHAKVGQLVVRISNKILIVVLIFPATPDALPTVIPDATVDNKGITEMRTAIEAFYHKNGITSATLAALSNEARADVVLAPPPAYQEVEDRPLRLLSLDGGGVRGVSPLRILKRIMAKVAVLENNPAIKPCEYFDMIAGTSTGGLIALMLGRLEMTIEQCEEKYDEISRKLFANARFGEKFAFTTGTYMYDPQPLTDSVKAIVEEVLGDSEALMFDESNGSPRCKVLVMSALASKVEDGNTAVHLRNYKTGDSIPSEGLGWKIWEVARATSAAPAYLPKFVKDNSNLEFVDGGLGWNNPAYELFCELGAVYGWNFSLGCFLSIGTGTPPDLHLGTGLSSIPDFISIATNSDKVHFQLQRSAPSLPRQGDIKKYWRFNMNKETSGQDWVERVEQKWWGDKVTKEKYDDVMVRMDDWTALNLIRELTDQWLDHGREGKESIADKVAACATRIVTNKAILPF